MPTGTVPYGTGTYGGGGGGGTSAPAVLFPTLIYEIAFTTDPVSGAPAWEDVSDDVESADLWSANRQRETDVIEAGHGTLTLRDDDPDSPGKYDPRNPSSPFAPYLLPMCRFRVRIQWMGTTYTRWTGYVEDWHPAHEYPGTSTVTVPLVDAFAAAALIPFDAAGYELEVMLDNPTTVWRLGEASSDSPMTDSVGGFHGRWEGYVQFGQDSLIDGTDQTSVKFSSDAADRGVYAGQGPFTSLPFSIDAPIDCAPADGELRFIVSCDAETGLDFEFYVANDTVTFGRPSGVLGARFPSGYTVESSARVDIGKVRHVGLTVDAGGVAHLYVDGVEDTNVLTAGTATMPTISTINIGNRSTRDAFGGFGLDGRMQMLAVYPTELSAGRMAAHAAAVKGFAGELTGERFTRLLDLAGWPAADRVVDVGHSTMQAASLVGSNLLNELQTVAETEGGAVYPDAAGRLRFRDRLTLLQAPYDTPQGMFSDGATGISYDDLDSDPPIDAIKNVAIIGRQGGPFFTAKDETSKRRYFPRSIDKRDYLFELDLEAEARAIFTVARYKDPQPRFAKLELTPYGSETDLYPQILGRELGDRITVTEEPPGQSARSFDMHIEGVHDELGPALQWRTTWQLSPADPNTYFVSDVDTSDGPAVLAY